MDQILKLGSTPADDHPALGSELADLNPSCGPPETNLQFGSGSTLETKPGPEETRTYECTVSLQAESSSDLEVDSGDPEDLWSECQLDLKIESSSDLQSDSEDTRIQPGSRCPEDAELESEPRDLPPESGDLLTNSKPEETREPSSWPGSRLDQPRWRSRDLDKEPTSGGCGSTCGSGDLCPKRASEETTNLPPGATRTNLQVESRLQQGSGSVKPGSRPEETRRSDHRPGSEDSGSGPEAKSDLRSTSDQPRSTLDPETNTDLETIPVSPEGPGPQSKDRSQQSGPGPEVVGTPPGGDQPANQRRELLLSWERLMDEVTFCLLTAATEA